MILINSYAYTILDPFGPYKSKTTYFREITDFNDESIEFENYMCQNNQGPVRNLMESNADVFSQLLFQLQFKNSHDYSKSNKNNELIFIYPTDSVLISYDFIGKIEFTNILDITRYLQNHRDIIEYVVNGCRLVVNNFSPLHPIKMELITDVDGISTLYLFVYFKVFEENKLEIIDSLNHQIGQYFIGKSAFFLISSRYD